MAQGIISPIYIVDVDHKLPINQLMYVNNAINGYGEIAVLKEGKIIETITYRDWDESIGQRLLNALPRA